MTIQQPKGSVKARQAERHRRIASSHVPDEINLYDRQIRLWGMDAQEKSVGSVSPFEITSNPFRLRTAKLLLIGLRALGSEVAKNLVLAGIGCLTIVDDGQVTEADLGAQFLISQEDVGKNVSLVNDRF